MRRRGCGFDESRDDELESELGGFGFAWSMRCEVDEDIARRNCVFFALLYDGKDDATVPWMLHFVV